MTSDLRRELRLTGLMLAILLTYGAIVTACAVAYGQTELLLGASVGKLTTLIWAIALIFVFCAYALDLVIRRRPARPLMVMAGELRAGVRRPDQVLARGLIIFSSLWMIVFFSPFKAMIGHVQGFPLDAALQRLDRLMFAGHDPWQLTHALFGSPPATAALQLTYNIWFVMTWLSLVYIVLRPELTELRARYLLAFMLTWILIGSFGAYFLASAGPCYYERLLGDPHFRPLMDRLHAIDAELKAAAPTLGVHALKVQDVLWASFTTKRELFGGGISAMPSMHVATSVLMACAGWKLGRTPGWLLTLFAALIWIGSIHLGWHYALDGVVGLGLTLAVWRLSGWLVDRLVMREAPAAALQPALAE